MGFRYFIANAGVAGEILPITEYDEKTFESMEVNEGPG